MTVTVVLQLAGDALAEGRLVGWAEEVRTGRRIALRGADDLLGFLGCPASRANQEEDDQ